MHAGIQWLYSSVRPFTWFMGGLQLYYLYEVFATNDTGGFSFSFMAISAIVWSIFTVMYLFQALAMASNNRVISFCFVTIGVLLFTITTSYHFGANDHLNWGVIIENLSIAFSPESADVMIHSLDTRALVYGLIIMIVSGCLEYKYRIVSGKKTKGISLTNRQIVFAIYGVFLILPIEPYDPIMLMGKSVYFYYKNTDKFSVKVQENDWPLYQPLHRHQSVHSARPEYIFLIVVESLNADVIGKKSEDGVVYTPFLNQLRHNSVFVDPFYGNSIQTAKGHFALFFSSIPILSGKTFVKYPSLKTDSIASVLSKNGYKTVAFSAHNDPNFDNTRAFFLNHGFDSYEIVDTYLTPDDRMHRLRWGVKDAVFFDRFFDYFDSNTTNQPEFYALLTIANHFPFNSMATSDQVVYPNPSSIQHHYANSIRMVDDGIRQFYRELDARGIRHNSLVIVTADHAFPLGIHGNYHLEAGYHDDSFRIPFFMTWPDALDEQTITTAASQMDIPVTIMDALSIHLPMTNFQGTSILLNQPHPIYLIQPYAKHFSVIRYPYKYRYFSKIDTEYVYHLMDDPMETTSIIETIPHDLLAIFRSDLKKIYLSNTLIQRNQLKP